MLNINVEVVFALPDKQYIQTVQLRQGATVEEAINTSGLLQFRKDIDLNKNKVGIFNQIVKLSDIVQDGDRVEIYRQLIIDPKEIRRKILKVKTNRIK